MGKSVALETRPRGQKRRRTRPAIPYAATIGVRASDTQELIHQVERGFSYETFKNLLATWSVAGLSSSEIAELLQVPPRTLTRRKQAGKFATDESERLLRLSRVLDATAELFEGDRLSAVAWLRSPNRALNGEKPIEMTKTEIGAGEVENLIGRLEYGVYS